MRLVECKILYRGIFLVGLLMHTCQNILGYETSVGYPTLSTTLHVVGDPHYYWVKAKDVYIIIMKEMHWIIFHVVVAKNKMHRM